MIWPTVVIGLIVLVMFIINIKIDDDWKTKPFVCFTALILGVLVMMALWWAGYVFPRHVEVLP